MSQFSFPILAEFQHIQRLNPARTSFPTVPSPSIEDSTTDPPVQAVAEILSALKELLTAVHPLSYPLTMLSISNFKADTGHIYKDRFQTAVQNPGLELMHPIRIASRSALSYFNTGDCYSTMEEPGSNCPLRARGSTLFWSFLTAQRVRASYYPRDG